MELHTALLIGILLPLIGFSVWVLLIILVLIQRLFCRHQQWKTLGIAWNGTKTVQCTKCLKEKSVPFDE
jgi:hypothetical protein